MVVDDHPLLREGIAAVLAVSERFEFVAEASNGREAIDQFVRHRPDVTLMDLQMPVMNGLDAIIALRRLAPQANIIVLTTYKGDVQVLRALRAGAAGYLLKGALRTDLVEAIDRVHAGHRYIPQEIAMELAAHLDTELLSSRELEVLSLVAQGNANKRVALELSISEETVKAHMSTILSKLGARDRTHAVTIAIKRGIIEL
jgi:two-component system NarL family response regulator